VRKEGKAQVVAEMAEKLAACQTAFLADYRGLDVEQINQLRGELRKLGVEYRVVKNTLLRLAAKNTDVACLTEFLEGPNAIALAGDDPVAPAKVLTEFAKKNDAFEIKAGVLGGKMLSLEEIKALADLPGREGLLAKILGSLNAPASNFVGVLAAVPRSFVQVLAAIQAQKEG
jgi:large subunit ribosomal protein L10